MDALAAASRIFSARKKTERDRKGPLRETAAALPIAKPWPSDSFFQLASILLTMLYYSQREPCRPGTLHPTRKGGRKQMGYRLSYPEADELFRKLSAEYEIYAPKLFEKQGRYSDTDIVRYDRVKRAEEIVWDRKSDFSAKEVVSPITRPFFTLPRTNTARAARAPKSSSSSCAPATSTRLSTGQDLPGERRHRRRVLPAGCATGCALC